MKTRARLSPRDELQSEEHLCSVAKAVACPGAQSYAALLSSHGGTLREDGRGEPRTCGEIELQARWYAAEFGETWETEDGRTIEILDFGAWNREAGPDFCGAVVRFGDSEVRRGDIELDLDVRDWEKHGHSANPHFDEAVLHVFFRRPSSQVFTRTSRNEAVAQVYLGGERDRRVRASAAWPKHVTLGGADANAASRILANAAAYRLQRKATMLRRAAVIRGEGAAVFEALAVALGYKNNKIPFLLLAQRAGLTAAAARCGEALLFGLAGFLESREVAGEDDATRHYLRGLWDQWWEMRSANERLVIERKQWTLSGMRPANHPQRRLAALRGVAVTMPALVRAVRRGDRDGFVRILTELEHPFWNRRASLNAAPLKAPSALIGGDRIRDVLCNVFYPLVVSGRAQGMEDFAAERGPAPSRSIARLASRLLDPAVATGEFLSRAVHQQGLLQIGADLADVDEPADWLIHVSRSAH